MALKAWATETLPASTRVIGHHIETTFGVSYTRSGLIKPMAALDSVWRKPDLVPSKLDPEAQKAFVEHREKLRDGPEADKAIVTATSSTPPIRPGRRACGCRGTPTSRFLRRRAAIG